MQEQEENPSKAITSYFQYKIFMQLYDQFFYYSYEC